MRSSEQILQAAFQLASRRPYDKITYAEVAREAGVHWTTVQRFFGSREKMRCMLKERQSEESTPLADTRSKILTAAARVFAKYGYTGATLDLVAQDAGMTKGAVYWHFAGKGELFLALCERSLNQLLRGLPQQTEEVVAAPDPIAAFTRLLQSQFATCEQGEGEQPLLFFEFIASSREPAVKEKLAEAFGKVFAKTSQLLAEMQRNQQVTARIDPQAMAVMLHAVINGMVLMWLIAPGQVSLSTMAVDVSKMIWQGIQPEGNEFHMKNLS